MTNFLLRLKIIFHIAKNMNHTPSQILKSSKMIQIKTIRKKQEHKKWNHFINRINSINFDNISYRRGF